MDVKSYLPWIAGNRGKYNVPYMNSTNTKVKSKSIQEILWEGGEKEVSNGRTKQPTNKKNSTETQQVEEDDYLHEPWNDLE